VDEEFNKISFSLDVSGIGSYNTVLTRNPQTGQYTLSYERPSVANDDKTLTAASLEALASEMSRRPTEFSQSSINTVRAQAALIPAVALSQTEQRQVKEILTAFYLDPNPKTYSGIGKVYAFYDRQTGSRYRDREAYLPVITSYGDTLEALSRALCDKVVNDATSGKFVLGPNDTIESIYQQR
jgi:hypothetical protein